MGVGSWASNAGGDRGGQRVRRAPPGADLAAQGHTLRLLVRGGAGTDTWSQGQAVVMVDLGGDPAAIAEAVRGCDGLVNLVGIKTARAQSFGAAHVTVVERMIAGCEAAGVGRMIHVSVAGWTPGRTGPTSRASGQASRWWHGRGWRGRSCGPG
jgi:uncharacterized protein YbjT (DUF2867 family)